jgi:uncharacterized membrane protein
MEQEKEPRIEDPVRSKNLPLDLITIIVLSLITIGAVFLLSEGNIVRVLIGSIFLLFCPGYVLVSLLWPKRNELNGLERIALSLGLSIAIIIIVGLILNYIPWGLGLESILFSIFGFILVAALFAWFRRLKVPANERFDLKLSGMFQKGELSKVDMILTILIVSSLVVAVGAFAYVAVKPKEAERFTEFYILDQNRTTNDYPRNLTVGENGTVIIGVVNHEGEEINYNVVVNLFNETEHKNDTWNFTFALDNTEKREIDFTFKIATNGTYQLEFLLFMDAGDEAELELHINGIEARD